MFFDYLVKWYILGNDIKILLFVVKYVVMYLLLCWIKILKGKFFKKNFRLILLLFIFSDGLLWFKKINILFIYLK